MTAKETILEYMRDEDYHPLTCEELIVKFDMAGPDCQAFRRILQQLENEGLVVKTKKKKYIVIEKSYYVVGWLQGNRNGFGFIRPDNPQLEDYYVNQENMNGAMHKDRVIGRPIPSKGYDGRKEAEIVKILDRANKKIIGQFQKNRQIGFVVPDNNRIFYDIFIPPEKQMKAKKGDKVIVEIESWPQFRRNPEGKIIDILGSSETPGIETESMIFRLGLPSEFPKAIKNAVANISADILDSELERRLDLRSEFIFTIDGADAKDFDDAISLVSLDNTWVKLGVHIADVAEYVQKNSPIDKEGRERATSIYLIDRVIPMLPERLSNDLCSLQPDKDRLTVSVFMEINRKTGELRIFAIHESVINSKGRLTYDEVNNHLSGTDRITEKLLASTLDQMNLLADTLKEKRMQKGCIDFDLPEPYIELGDNGEAISISKKVRGKAEALIEEFMILTNEVVAELFFSQEIPSIYRIHEKPDTADIMELNEFLRTFGYQIEADKGEITPGSFQKVLEKIEDTSEEKIIKTMILRSLKQARYHQINLGHFGLASDCYTHFTAPIRRYPDLIIHRMLKDYLKLNTLTEVQKKELLIELPEICKHSSEMERRAVEAERESLKIKMVEIMAREIGKYYSGHISHVVPFGFFVELDNMIEGLVHISSLIDDFYEYDKSSRSLEGEEFKQIYRLGDPVNITVAKVNKTTLEIDFYLSQIM